MPRKQKKLARRTRSDGHRSGTSNGNESVHEVIEQIQDRMVVHSDKLAELTADGSLSQIVPNLPEIKRQLSLLEGKVKAFRSFLSKPFHQMTQLEQLDVQ